MKTKTWKLAVLVGMALAVAGPMATAQEAKAYGLIDEVMIPRQRIPTAK